MRAAILATAFVVCAKGAAIERELRERDPQLPWISLGRPTASVTWWPGGGSPNPTKSLGDCGLDSFEGHTAQASLFCSSLLKTGTSTFTQSVTARVTTTLTQTVLTTFHASTSATPSSTPAPVSSSSLAPSSTSIVTPTSTPTPSSTPSSATPSATPSSASSVYSSTSSSAVSSPAPTSSATCGIVGYTAGTSAYNFDSSGTSNTFALCSAKCKADSRCKSFGYGQSNCMLFDVPTAGNVNISPSSPYVFYDVSCPSEIQGAKQKKEDKRQIHISIPNIGGPDDITSACQCYLTSVPAAATRTATVTAATVKTTITARVTSTVTA